MNRYQNIIMVNFAFTTKYSLFIWLLLGVMSFSNQGLCYADIHANNDTLGEHPTPGNALEPSLEGPQEPPEQVLKMSLSQALQLAIESNRDVQISTLFPSIAREAQKSTEAIYDSSAFATGNLYETDRPIQSVLDNGTDGTTGKDYLEEDGWKARAGLRKSLSTGGTASIYLEADHLDSNSDLVLPNPQYTSRLTIQLRQALLKEFGDRTNKSNIEKAGINVKVAEAQQKKILAGVLRDVAASYWRFTYYYQQLKLSQQAVQDAGQITKILANRKERGLSNMLDIDRAEAVYQDRNRSLLADSRNFKTSMNQLKLLLGIPTFSNIYETEITPTEKIVYQAENIDKHKALQQALEQRLEVQIAKLRIASTKIDKNLAKHKKLPTLDAKVSYSHNALGEDLGDTVSDTIDENQASWAIGLELDWPIGGNKSEAEHLKLVFEQRKKQIELKKIFEQIGFEIFSASTKVEELSEETQVAHKAEDAYTRVLKREEARYKIAKVDNQRLLDAQDDVFQAKRDHLRAVLNLNIALLDFSWAKGTLLEKLTLN